MQPLPNEAAQTSPGEYDKSMNTTKHETTVITSAFGCATCGQIKGTRHLTGFFNRLHNYSAPVLTTNDDDDDDDDNECEGHESLRGADMGVTVYCDGTCR